MWNAGLDEAHTGIKIAGRNISNRRYADDTTLMAESEEELWSLLMKVKEETEKVVLKLNMQKTHGIRSKNILGIQSHHFLANRWGNNGNSERLYSLGLQILADDDCSCEIKRCLLLGRKVMTNLDSILKNRDTTLLTEFQIVKAMVFPVVMYGCESWAIKKAEHRRIDSFELWCWRRLLRLPWTAQRSNH